MSDIDTVVVVVGLKALDPEWPIREAEVGSARGGRREEGLEMTRLMLWTAPTLRHRCAKGWLR